MQLARQVDNMRLATHQHGKPRGLLWHQADLQLLEIRLLATPVLVRPFVFNRQPGLASDKAVRAGAGRPFLKPL